MTFDDPGPSLSTKDIERIEHELGVKLPTPVAKKYAESNGGEPDRYVLDMKGVSTVVTEFLPLHADERMNASRSYRLLVLRRKIVARHFFPFAIDGGGDYFFVDTTSEDGCVLFFRADEDPGEELLDLGVSFEEFWSLLSYESTRHQ